MNYPASSVPTATRLWPQVGAISLVRSDAELRAVSPQDGGFFKFPAEMPAGVCSSIAVGVPKTSAHGNDEVTFISFSVLTSPHFPTLYHTLTDATVFANTLRGGMPPKSSIPAMKYTQLGHLKTPYLAVVGGRLVTVAVNPDVEPGPGRQRGLAEIQWAAQPQSQNITNSSC